MKISSCEIKSITTKQKIATISRHLCHLSCIILQTVNQGTLENISFRKSWITHHNVSGKILYAFSFLWQWSFPSVGRVLTEHHLATMWPLFPFCNNNAYVFEHRIGRIALTSSKYRVSKLGKWVEGLDGENRLRQSFCLGIYSVLKYISRTIGFNTARRLHSYW